MGEGGNTVFPSIGAFIKPIKLAVAVWWNTDKAGGYDELMRHSGCPVIAGNKWVFNKWINNWSQMFKKPCPAISKLPSRQFGVDHKQFQQPFFFQEP